MATDITCRTKGIFYREHETRKHGKQKDKYYFIRYSVNKKQIKEAVGWASEGWTEAKVNEILTGIKANIRLGKHPQSLKEMREMNQKAVAEEKQEAIENESERITLDEVFARYIPVHRSQTAVKTAKMTESYYKRCVQEHIGNKKLIDITVNDIQAIVANALETKSSRTSDFVKTVMRQLFNFAKDNELYFKDNPTSKIKIKLTDNKRQRFLTQCEAKLLLNALKLHSIDVYEMAAVSLHSGLRAGEIMNLKWEDIIWHANRMAILDTKNGSNRIEPMHQIVREIFERRHQFDKTGYIFKAKNGGKMKEISSTYQRVVDGLGFNNNISDPRQKVVFHTLRHTYASWLVMNGVDLYTTQKLMGHKSNQMTQRYSHLAPGHLEKAISKLPTI